jgi:signal transduction histidine kinase
LDAGNHEAHECTGGFVCDTMTRMAEHTAEPKAASADESLERENQRLQAELTARIDEQSALRRVATAVAEQRPLRDIADCVTHEVAVLFGANGAALTRWEGQDRGTILSDWTPPGARGLAPGIINLEGDSAMARTYRTGAPARIDSYPALEQDTVAEYIRDIGVYAAVAAPVSVNGHPWGCVAIATTEENPFPASTEERLSEFAELVAQAIANAEAQTELKASRARIVQAADDARRQIERDLHDGAQQRLVGLALALRLARNAVEDPDATRASLDACAAELTLALDELRELARGIHPALLTDGGLSPALKAIAGRSTVPVELDDGLDGRLTPPQEAALYFTASEAVANVAKYAEATRIRVRVWKDDGEVAIEIQDDGVGGADPSRGSGLRGLADRVEALGGQVHVSSPAGGGTRLVAALPR